MLTSARIQILLSTILIFLFLGFSKTAASDDIILRDLNGISVDISNQKGKPVILFFWTTWCHFCRNEIKALNQKCSQIEKEGIAVFTVNVNEPEYKVKRFFNDYALKFRVLLDSDGLLAVKYGILGVPTYVFLDKTGRLISSENRLPADYKTLLLKKVNK
jgi:peroxiredoxin